MGDGAVILYIKDIDKTPLQTMSLILENYKLLRDYHWVSPVFTFNINQSHYLEIVHTLLLPPDKMTKNVL